MTPELVEKGYLTRYKVGKVNVVYQFNESRKKAQLLKKLRNKVKKKIIVGGNRFKAIRQFTSLRLDGYGEGLLR